jgi:hypothetical protein
MKWIAWLALAGAACGQTGSVEGTVVDAKTRKPVPTAIVMASRAGAPPFSRNTRSGGDGAFRISGLAPGSYTLCVQVREERYLDPCDWDAKPAVVTVTAGRSVMAGELRLTEAALVEVEVEDAQNLLRQTVRDGRRPELSVGVWGPRGLYFPAREMGGRGGPSPGPGGMRRYLLAAPRDMTLTLAISSRDLRLGDAAGAALAGNEKRETFQHATGVAGPRKFAVKVLGLAP